MNKLTLSLMGKIEKKYIGNSRGDKEFLSFLPDPITYPSHDFILNHDDIKDMDPASATLEAYRNLRDFSFMVDDVVKDQNLYEKNSEDRFSDIYEYTLRTCNIIEIEQSEADKLLIKEAEEIYSKYHEIYMQWKEKYDALSEKILSPDDEEYKNLIKERKTVEDGWIMVGHKGDYETALAKKKHLIKNSFFNKKSNMIEDIEKVKLSGVSLGMLDYVPSFCYPSNFHSDESTGWSKISMSNTELEDLYTYAKNTLFSQHDIKISSDDLEIKELNADFIEVVISRDWMNQELFKSNLWDLPNGAEQLSDGNTPASGTLPSYITSLIFMKNVDVELKENSIINKKTIKKLSKATTPSGWLNLKHVEKNKLKSLKRINRKQAKTIKEYKELPITSKQKSRKIILSKQLRIDLNKALEKKNPSKKKNISIKKLKMFNSSFAQNNKKIITSPTHLKLKTPLILIKSTRPTVLDHRKETSINAQQNTEFEKEFEEKYGNSLALVGYICKRLDKTPNPIIDLIKN